MSETVVFFTLTSAIIVFGLAHSWWHTRRTENRHREVLADAKTRGLDVPVSLHPIIDPDICMGSAACVRGCPEQDVLGLISSRGKLVAAANCIGHGRCASSCPVDAISLVFGTATRGVELPEVSPVFESSVSGIYIAGELGGMGLIANAFEQAIQAVDALAESLVERGSKDIVDVAVIGAGPAGVAGALRAKELGLSYLCLEQGTWGGAVRTYPRKKIVMTRPVRVPLYGPVKLKETSKEALLELWEKIIKSTGLQIQENTKLVAAQQQGDVFELTTSTGTVRARRVLLAIGRRGSPRLLGVPGEDGSNVATQLSEAACWAGMKVVVAGGGDVAVEAALSLSEQEGTEVTLVHRSAVINRPKAALREKLAKAQVAQQLRVLLETKISQIKEDRVLMTRNDGTEQELMTEQVFVCIGGQLPTAFLESLGISMVTKFGEA